ncbi:SubName: Full=Related to kinesin light chain {ECO:0000313/EMBL:CCA74635.1} [Serendipita indica DSM 11827]|nr:SubName: Full=Related to kinesin light chain {ECO:0000313/EMBL:CCA74635.1} [Serendipita indica DSM 11827]
MPRSKIDDLGFLELSPGTDPVVDIVAIHGLDGHREKTWTTDDGILWLRDLLPSNLPNARILSYGYDADTQSKECVSTQTMRRHAEGLAQALSRQRTHAPRRPIIFVAHNIGGIILKWALVICHNQNPESKCDLRDILVSTHAILFFGTPHSGFEGTTLLTAIDRFASMYTKTTNVLLKDLENHSSELENVQSLYVAASEKFNSIFFCEAYKTPAERKRRKLNVPHHAAVIAGDRNATTIVLHASHEDLVRFHAADRDNYRTVLHHLKDYSSGATTAVSEKWTREDIYRSAARGESGSQEVARPKSLPPASISYIERPELQSLITQKLLPGGDVGRQPRCILYGLGGAGKTQLATRWIRKNKNKFTRVIVIDATSQAQLEADLERSIRTLGTEYSKMTWEDAVSHLDYNEKGWLLFMDNADSSELNLDPYLPGSIHGAIIITTRNRGCIGHAPNGAIPVGELEESEAINLLHTVSNIPRTSGIKSVEIVRELGMLALAVTQAGAYIRTTQRPDTYLESFRKHRKRLMSKVPGEGTHYPSSTYTAFDLSFRRLPTKTQDFMRICAFLHHSLIPYALFQQSTESKFITPVIRASWAPPESDKVFTTKLEGIFGLEWDEITFQETVDSALHASLISVSTDGLFYTVHPLLQTYIKDGLNEEENFTYIRMTAQLLLGATQPFESSNGHRWQLLAHVNSIPRSVQSQHVASALAFGKFYESLADWNACQDLLEVALPNVMAALGQRHKDSLWLMSLLAGTLRVLSQLEKAETMQREILSLHLDILGPRNLDTVTAMHDLAVTLNERGQLEEAETMKREVLALRLDILGRRHLDTVRAMHNLATTLHGRGQWEEAETIQREALALQLDILGRRHLDTVHAIHNLAVTLHGRGQLEEAETMKREVLALRLEILGRRHQDTVRAMHNLAITLHGRGQLEETETIQREVLALRLDILGRRHLDTVWAMDNLATTLHGRGQLEEAETIQREVLALRLDILGRRHLDTVRALHTLAVTLHERGQLEEAETIQREVLALRLDILGRRHLDTVWAMDSLAATLHGRGQLEEAETIQREVLALRLDILGRGHQDTVDAMDNLAITLHECGQLEEAETIQREVLALRLDILGRRHLATVHTMDNLAITLHECGQLEEAETIQREVLALRLDILGRGHQVTVNAMDNLAITLHGRGQLEEAETMKREVLALRLDILGRGHQDTVDAMDNLAITLHESGQLEQAEPIQREVLALRLDILGRRHLDTVRAMENLAATLHGCNQLEEAEIMRRDAFALRLEILGP